MSIKLIAEGRYDTAHAVYVAHEISKSRLDAVFFELPEQPFQEILDEYSAGKFGEDALKRKLFATVKKSERRIDNELVKKFIKGDVEAEELETIGSSGREVHFLQAAKRAKAKMYAMDMPLEEIEGELVEEAGREHIKNAKAVLTWEKQLPNLVWELNEILHYPFYILERVLRHHAILTTNPYKHNVNYCRVCRLGAAYDRAVSTIAFGIFNFLPLSGETKADIKVASLLRKMDFAREKYMASVIVGRYKELKKELGREPKVLVIVHLWHAARLRFILKDLG